MYQNNDIAAHASPTVTPKSNGENQVGLDLITGGDREKGAHAIPASCSLDGSTEINCSPQGIELAALLRFDTIVVRTANSHYRIFLLDPDNGRALLEGGAQITEPMEVRVIGSSFGGIMLLTGWICVGLRMEACGHDKYISTSPVQSLCVEHQTAFEVA